ncbi:MAG: hypothetical protein WCJ13_06520 [Coriobacteriia bacterium]
MSDQDFFFDEDEKPAKSGGNAPAKKAGSSPSRTGSKSTASSAGASAQGQSVSMTIAVLMAVIGILLGAVIGLFVGKSMAVPSVAGTIGAGAATTQQAPQLTPDQLNSGELPAGHPSVGGAAAATPTPAPKK